MQTGSIDKKPAKQFKLKLSEEFSLIKISLININEA
jgi:hypothetical protein